MTRILKEGMSGPDVRAWKDALSPGDVFDAVTKEATRQWQRERGLRDDGAVGPATLAKLGHPPVPPVVLPARSSLPPMRFVQAKHFRKGRRSPLTDVVIHSAETSERATTAEALGAYFANPQRSNNAGELVPVVASAHYSLDSDSAVQSVLVEDTAFHVRAPGFNDRSIGIELAGRAAQTRAEWLDDYGQLMLSTAALLVRYLCDTWTIPMNFVDAAGLRAGEHGITGHVQVRDAFSADTHYDPGPNFPWDEFIERVRK